MSEEPMPKNYRLLKGIVITLGILIVAMVVIIIVAAIKKYNDQKSDEVALVKKYQNSKSSSKKAIEPFTLDLPLDAGQSILSADSGADAIVVRIGTNGVTTKIILIDYNGQIVGTINVK